MSKKRKIQQKAEDESKGAFMTLFKDWIVNTLDKDFGFDFEVRLTVPIDEKTQEVSEISFYAQNKSSIYSEKNKAIEDLAVSDWVLYLGQRIPVLITKYDIPNKKFYWEIAQDYLWDVIEKKDPNWRSKKTKRIILDKTISDLNEIKRAILASQKRITRYHSLNLSIGEGLKIVDLLASGPNAPSTGCIQEWGAEEQLESLADHELMVWEHIFDLDPDLGKKLLLKNKPFQNWIWITEDSENRRETTEYRHYLSYWIEFVKKHCPELLSDFKDFL